MEKTKLKNGLVGAGTLIITLVLAVYIFTACSLEQGETSLEETSAESVSTHITGIDAGYSLETMPNVKLISSTELTEKRGMLESGLYLVDIDYIPISLKDTMEEEGLTLNEDGSLKDEEGDDIIYIVKNSVADISEPTNSKTIVNLPWVRIDYTFSAKLKRGFKSYYSCTTKATTYSPQKVNGKWMRQRMHFMRAIASLGPVFKYSKYSDKDADKNISSVKAHKKGYVYKWWKQPYPYCGEWKLYLESGNHTYKIEDY